MHDPTFFSHVSTALQTDRLVEAAAARKGRQFRHEARQLRRQQIAGRVAPDKFERLTPSPSTR